MVHFLEKIEKTGIIRPIRPSMPVRVCRMPTSLCSSPPAVTRTSAPCGMIHLHKPEASALIGVT
jgi:hypothetical protein